jgi:hypothetical protein
VSLTNSFYISIAINIFQLVVNQSTNVLPHWFLSTFRNTYISNDESIKAPLTGSTVTRVRDYLFSTRNRRHECIEINMPSQISVYNNTLNLIALLRCSKTTGFKSTMICHGLLADKTNRSILNLDKTTISIISNCMKVFGTFEFVFSQENVPYHRVFPL